jgi:uncharacterized cupin superfamily protein
MAGRTKPIMNIADLKLRPWSRGDKYASADISFGAIIGMTGIGVSYNEVPPGKSGCPFHNHHSEDEMFVILEGEGTYRYGAEVHVVRKGDVLNAPAGDRDTAHQILNTGSGPLRYLGISNKTATDIVEYPDSGKFLAVRREDGKPGDRFVHLGRNKPIENWEDAYYDGEPGS